MSAGNMGRNNRNRSPNYRKSSFKRRSLVSRRQYEKNPSDAQYLCPLLPHDTCLPHRLPTIRIWIQTNVRLISNQSKISTYNFSVTFFVDNNKKL